MAQRQSIDRLILKSLLEDLTPQEEVHLNAWLEEKVANRERYKNLITRWNDGTIQEDWSSIDLDHNWRQILRKAEEGKAQIVPWPSILRYAAAATVLLLGVLWLLNQPVRETLANHGRKVQVHELPDGSRVWLRPGSSLALDPDDFQENRSLHLQGEAHFEVEKSKVPFIVFAELGSVQVLGTTFNMISQTTFTEVLLVEGVVQFSSPSDQILLAPGESARLERQGIQREMEPFHRNAIGWKTGSFEFTEVPLVQLLDRISPYYGFEVEIAPEKRNLLVTTSFHQLTIEELIAELTFILDIQVVLKDQILIIK